MHRGILTAKSTRESDDGLGFGDSLFGFLDVEDTSGIGVAKYPCGVSSVLLVKTHFFVLCNNTWGYKECVFGNLKSLNLLTPNTKRLYVLVPGDTLISLVWGIGLHGDQLPFAEHLHYVVPPILLWIPILRDILMWTGAITYSPTRPLDSILVDMLNRSRYMRVNIGEV